MPQVPSRPRSTLLLLAVVWMIFYASFTLARPALLDDADSVHVEVAREMLQRHDFVTLYANGIRYLEKAPLLYWMMAGSMKSFMLAGATRPETLAVAARLPLAFTVLALAFLVEALGRRMFRSRRAGLYASLIVLSSPGIFLFTRITIPDAMVCLWLTLALFAFWRTEELGSTDEPHLRLYCGLFAVACALNVLTKGLIGVVFPLGITLIYLAMTRGMRGAWVRLKELHPLATAEAFLIVAAPWHILAGLANPTQGHPAVFRYIWGRGAVLGHWQVPLPTFGNVHGWYWFYFMNEHLLRYLNLRVPHDYDTSPLWLFWGLCFVWLMPFSAFVVQAVAKPVKQWVGVLRDRAAALRPDGAKTLLLVWAALPLLFFSLSTRQEYYVLPALPAFALLLGGWLTKPERRLTRAVACVLALGGLFFVATIYFLLHAHAPLPGTDLASLLAQNPKDYALSMGHFLDLNAQALGLFRVPLVIAAVSLFVGPLVAFVLARKANNHGAVLSLAAGAFGFLLAAHLGLQTFAPVLTSAQLAEAIRPQVQEGDLVAIHGEYESGSTLGFYLQRNDVHILDGRSSNLWYGSFFTDAPAIFETQISFAMKWRGPQRVFLWQSLTDPPNQLPTLPGPVYVLARSGGKEIVSNQPSR